MSLHRPKSPATVDLFLNIRGLDRDKKNTFKGWCAQQDISMTEAVEYFIEEICSDGKLANQIVDRILTRREFMN